MATRQIFIVSTLAFAAICVTLPLLRASAHENGAIWYDTAGRIINAHGGGVLSRPILSLLGTQVVRRAGQSGARWCALVDSFEKM